MKSFIAKRPVYSVFSSERYSALTGQSPRSWRDVLAEYVRDQVK